MNDEISMPQDIVVFAGELVNDGPGALEFIKIHEFEGGEDTLDDYQEQIHQEFETIHQSLVAALSEKYGTPRQAEDWDVFDIIPLCGVFPASVWEVDGVELFLAISHEDRETPVLMVIGTA